MGLYLTWGHSCSRKLTSNYGCGRLGSHYADVRPRCVGSHPPYGHGYLGWFTSDSRYGRLCSREVAIRPCNGARLGLKCGCLGTDGCDCYRAPT